MGVLEEIEMRGCLERNRDVYFLMGQIEILRGNIMIGYKLFMEALKHLDEKQDETRIDYINSFIMPYKLNILKAIEFEKLIENTKSINISDYREAISNLYLIESVDRKYSDLIKLKLHSLVLEDKFELIAIIDEVYKFRYNDVKLAIYYLDMAFTHKDLVTMVELRDQVQNLIQENETIST